MELYTRDIDEYTKDSRQGNQFAPEWPFRLIVSGSSDSGKTTMIMNLLMGNKKIKKDGERYILCNDVILVGKYLNEPKWGIIRDFYNELAEEGEDVSFQALSPSDLPDVESFDPSRATVVVFEDLMNMSRKIQERIADYFSSGRHSNISPIYVSQRFFLIPKTVRENATHISLHRGAGSLSDIKRIISQYTDQSQQSESLVPVIDDLTLKKEFIIFDLRRSKIDPLSIRVRWDTSLRSILDQSQINLGSVNNASQINLTSSRWSFYGQKAIAQAKKDGSLINFARNMPNPKERKKLLANGISAKNSDIWARYVFREAYGIDDKDLGPEWIAFSSQIKASPITKQIQADRYKELLATKPLDNKKMIETLEILLWFLSNGHIKKESYIKGVQEIVQSSLSSNP
jgi:A32 protein